MKTFRLNSNDVREEEFKTRKTSDGYLKKPQTFVIKTMFSVSISETCQNENNADEEIIVKPTQKESSITYETVFDDKNNNNIDFDVATSTRRTKS